MGKYYKFTLLSIALLIYILSLPQALTASTKPKDVHGWDNVRWGMTDAEVQNILGKDVKKRPAKEDKKESMYTDLELKGILLGNKSYRASFWMGQNSKKLKRIVFVPMGEPDKYEWAEAFISLENYLVRKYGDPDIEETSNDPGTSALRVWKFPSTEIEMSYLQIEETELLLLVFSLTKDQK